MHWLGGSVDSTERDFWIKLLIEENKALRKQNSTIECLNFWLFVAALVFIGVALAGWMS
jgi:hypothetical protein